MEPVNLKHRVRNSKLASIIIKMYWEILGHHDSNMYRNWIPVRKIGKYHPAKNSQ